MTGPPRDEPVRPDGTEHPTVPVEPRGAYEPPPEAPVTSPTVPNAGYPPSHRPYQPGVARPTYPPTASYPTYDPNAYPPPYDPNAAYPGYAAAPRRRRGGLVVGLVIATVVVICAALGVAGVVLAINVAKNVVASGDTPNPQPAGPGPSSAADDGDGQTDDGTTAGQGDIVIEVTGDGPVSIFYGAGDGKSENLRQVELPWRITVPREGLAQVVIVLVTRVSLTDGEVTCRITLNGENLNEQTKDGKLAFASCTAVV